MSRHLHPLRASAERKDSWLQHRWNSALADLMRRGRCAEARDLFLRMPHRDTISWNALFSGYLLNRNFDSARNVFDEMPRRNVVTYNILLHDLALRRGHLSLALKLFDEMPHRNVISWNTIISAYARNGLVDEARAAFYRAPFRDHVSCFVLLTAYLHNNRFDDAVSLFRSKPTSWSLVACTAMMDAYMRRGYTHDARHLFDEMPHRDVVSWNSVISGYARNGQVDEARRLFDAAPRKNVLTWNAMVSGYAHNGFLDDARAMFDAMPERNVASWNRMIAAYAKHGKMTAAKELYDQMPCKDITSSNTMVSGYAHNGDIKSARKIFDLMPRRDVISWNAIISAYARNGLVDEARAAFYCAPIRNQLSLNALLAAYLHSNRLDDAVSLFRSNPTNRDVVSWNAMVDAHMKRGCTHDARHLFDEMPHRDTVSWNTVISGYAQNGQVGEARRLFDAAPGKNVSTWTAMVSGYAHNGFLDDARAIFDSMPERNAGSWNTMIAAYAKHGKMMAAKELYDQMPCKDITSSNTMLSGYAHNGDIDSARKIFDLMPRRDVISWSAMVTAYSQGGFSEEALHMFMELQRIGQSPNVTSFTCVLSTCADFAMLDCGRQLHGKAIGGGYEASCFVGNALVHMYCNCGSVEEAYDVFRDMSKDVVSWNTMIAGYAKHRFGEEALKVFDMMSGSGIKPDDITMVAVLAACNHAGLVDRGIDYFCTMHERYIITPKPVHYACMIDILGCSGRLDDAYKLLKDAPFEPDDKMWGALLGARRRSGNTKLAKTTAQSIFNPYVASGMWMKVGKQRIMMRDRGLRKMPDFSWIEVMNKIHIFSAGDSFHPEKDAIYLFLEELDERLKKADNKSSTELVLHDVEEEQKESILRYRSEKLATAYGIMKIPPDRPIRIIKNRRVCEDCHVFMKQVSAIESRLIILRDDNRFHHFKDGLCSCGDYW